MIPLTVRRRWLLVWLAAVLAADSFGLSALAAEPVLPPLAEAGQQTLEHFRPYEGQLFRVYGGPAEGRSSAWSC